MIKIPSKSRKWSVIFVDTNGVTMQENFRTRKEALYFARDCCSYIVMIARRMDNLEIRQSIR